MNSLNKLNILVADDHPLFRKGVRVMLREFSDISLIEEASNGLEAVKALKKKHFDIVFLDIEMPVLDGIETAKIIVKEYPSLKILILSSHDSIRFIAELMKIGIHGYILKSLDQEEAILAINTVLDDKLYLSPEIKSSWDNYNSQKLKQSSSKLADDKIELTNREMQIVEEICELNSSSEIANKLSISKATVDNHRRSILKKLKTDSIVAVVIYAIQKGIYKIRKK